MIDKSPDCAKAADVRVNRSINCEAAASAINFFSFSAALDKLKRGACVSRRGWNGPNQFVYLNRGSFDQQPRDNGEPINGIPLYLFNLADAGTSTRLPNFNLHTAQGHTLTGWLASQSDLLAEDWYVVH
jgi:hypothetical protein